jgi:cytochrome c
LAWRRPLAADFEVIPESSLRTTINPGNFTSPGRKKLIADRLSQPPGRGAPLAGLHPAMDRLSHPVRGTSARVSDVTFDRDDSVLLLTTTGEILRAPIPDRDGEVIEFVRIAEGLDDPGGLVAADDGLWVLQREELTRLRDLDGDGIMDEYMSMATGWPILGDDAGRARGLLPVKDRFLAMLTLARDDTGAPIASAHRGTLLSISRDGSWTVLDDGLIDPAGFIEGVPGGAIAIDHAAAGGIAPIGGRGPFGEHGICLPEGTPLGGHTPQPTSGVMVQTGPLRDQMVLGDAQLGGLRRLRIDVHDNGWQGSLHRLAQGVGDSVDDVTIGPDDRLWVAGHDESGLHLHRLSMSNLTAFEISGISAYANGLRIDFTSPVTPIIAIDPAAWVVLAASSGRTPGPVSQLAVERVAVIDSGRAAFLSIQHLQPGTLLHVQLVGVWEDLAGRIPHAAEAWYTMHRVPRRVFDIPNVTHRDRHNTLTPQEKAQGFELLFDGTSAPAWRGFNKDHLPEGWTITDGTITWTSSSGDIITREQYDNFEFLIDWRIEPGGNSGIFYNVTEDGHSVWLTGPEMQILDNERHPDGRSPLTCAGSNYALHAPRWDMTGPPGSWNRARIVVRGDQVEHWLNGVLVVDYVLDSPEWKRRVADSKFNSMPDYGRRNRGHIALQDHGDVVSFRNIKIRKLDSPGFDDTQ